MNTDVAERTQVAHAKAAREHPLEHGAEMRQVGVTSPPDRDEWRWIPDAGEIQLPATPLEKRDGTWGHVITAVAWASARFWG